jgi:HEAT repeat protein
MKSFLTQLEDLINRTPEDNREKVRREIDAVGASSHQDWLALVADAKANPEFRLTACWVLAAIGNSRAFSALGRALQDDNPRVRGAAAGNLVNLRARVKRGAYAEVVDRLLHAFQSDPDVDVRVQAAFALREFHDPRTLEPLIATVRNTQEPAHLRDVAAEALAYLPDVRVIAPMIGALHDPEEVVRISAAYTLGSLAGAHTHGSFTGSEAAAELDRAVMPLIKALQDPAEKVRYWVVRALGDLRDPRALTALQRIADTDKGTWYGDEVAEAARYSMQAIQESQGQ